MTMTTRETRQQTIDKVGKYFGVKELVCSHTYDRWGESSWAYLSTDWLETLLVIRRDILARPMTCNHGAAQQRGLRCNRCDLVRSAKRVYLSGHVLGRAGDFGVAGMTAEEARRAIISKQDLLPHPIRLEGGVSWLHIDTLPQCGIKDKVYVFKD